MTSFSTVALMSNGAELRRLYLVRFAFAAVWAGLLALTLPGLGLAAGVLLVLYPAFDAAAAVVDARLTAAAGGMNAVFGNVAASSLAAAGLAVAAFSGVPAALRVWGAWAVVAGVLQLVVALPRRHSIGGQTALVLSGAGSVVAGIAFVLIASADDPTLAVLTGYALVGATLFLVSALRLKAAT